MNGNANIIGRNKYGKMFDHELLHCDLYTSSFLILSKRHKLHTAHNIYMKHAKKENIYVIFDQVCQNRCQEKRWDLSHVRSIIFSCVA